MRRYLLTVGVLALLAGCDQTQGERDKGAAAERPPTAEFVSVLDGDSSGYYLPTAEGGEGGWVFHHMFLGQKPEFEAWEAGQRSGTFAPVMIEFENTASPMVQTELGESRSGRDRVLPTRYRVTNRRVEFEGRSAGLGIVRFEGDLDPGALAESKRNLGSEDAVLTGTLTVGDQVRRVSLRWWAGD